MATMNPQALLNVIQAEELVGRLRLAANRSSEIHRGMAEAKSLRQEGNHERRTDLYMWPEAAQTIEGQPADLIETLLSATADLTRQLAEVREALAAINRVLLPIDMQFAQAECIDEPIPDEAVVLHFMGSGASDQVTAGEYRAAKDAIRRSLTSKEEHHG